MATRKFKGSARAKGFSPVGFSNAAEQRIAQQTSRVVAGMERYRDSDLENRRRILNEMERNAEATQRQIARDEKILSDNKQTEINQAQANERARKEQFIIDSRATASMFEDVKEFSETAAKVANAFEQQRVDEEYWEGVRARQLAGPLSEQQLAYDAAVSAEGIAVAEMEGGISIAEARGANPLATSKARVSTYWGSQGWQDADIKLTTENSYNAFRDDHLRNSTDLIQLPDGEQIQVNEARGDTAKTAAAIAYIQRKFISASGLDKFSAERLGPALDFMQRSNQQAIAQEAALETKRNQSLLKQGALNTFSSGELSPIDANNSFNALVNANDGDYIKTFNELEDGVRKGLIQPEALAGIIMPDGKTLGESKRYQRLQDLHTKYLIGQTDLEVNERKAAYKQKTNEWLEYFDENPDATTADLQAAAASYAGDPEGVPDWLKKRIRYRDPSGQQQAQFLIETADDAAKRGTLTTELVNKVYEVDPAKARELAAKLDAQNQFANNDSYKEYMESLEGLIKKSVDAVDTPNGTAVLRFMQKNFQELVTRKVAGGMSIEDASREAAFEIRDKVNSGRNDKGAEYYRIYDPATESFEFPNFSSKQTAGDKAKEASTLRAQKVLTSSGSELQKTLSTPGALYSNQELERIFSDFELSPVRFKIPATFQIIADRTLENPMTLLNRVMKNQIGKELPLTPSMKLLDSASPKARQLLQRHKSANRSIRGLGETSKGFNKEVIQPMYVPMIEEAAMAHTVPAPEIAALIEIESGFRPEVPSYNNSSFGMMQINKSAHPEFFATENWRDPQANINYGTKYYSQLKKQFGGDPVAAAMAYNAGPGNYQLYLQGTMPDGRKKTEMINHGRKFAKALYKYQGNASGMLQSPSTLRLGSPLHVYTSGNIGPTSTGPHLDVKRSDRGEFNPNALDNFVEVDDPELGRVPLGQVPITGDFASHTVRGSHGIDYGTHSGSKIYLKNGAKVVGTTPSEHGDVLTIELPDGSRYTMLHGTSAK